MKTTVEERATAAVMAVGTTARMLDDLEAALICIEECRQANILVRGLAEPNGGLPEGQRLAAKSAAEEINEAIKKFGPPRRTKEGEPAKVAEQRPVHPGVFIAEPLEVHFEPLPLSEMDEQDRLKLLELNEHTKPPSAGRRFANLWVPADEQRPVFEKLKRMGLVNFTEHPDDDAKRWHITEQGQRVVVLMEAGGEG